MEYPNNQVRWDLIKDFIRLFFSQLALSVFGNKKGKSKAEFPFKPQKVNTAEGCPDLMELTSEQGWKLSMKEDAKTKKTLFTLTYTADEKNFPGLDDSFKGPRKAEATGEPDSDEPLRMSPNEVISFKAVETPEADKPSNSNASKNHQLLSLRDLFDV